MTELEEMLDEMTFDPGLLTNLGKNDSKFINGFYEKGGIDILYFRNDPEIRIEEVQGVKIAELLNRQGSHFYWHMLSEYFSRLQERAQAGGNEYLLAKHLRAVAFSNDLIQNSAVPDSNREMTGEKFLQSYANEIVLTKIHFPRFKNNLEKALSVLYRIVHPDSKKNIWIKERDIHEAGEAYSEFGEVTRNIEIRHIIDDLVAAGFEKQKDLKNCHLYYNHEKKLAFTYIDPINELTPMELREKKTTYCRMFDLEPQLVITIRPDISLQWELKKTFVEQYLLAKQSTYDYDKYCHNADKRLNAMNGGLIGLVSSFIGSILFTTNGYAILTSSIIGAFVGGYRGYRMNGEFNGVDYEKRYETMTKKSNFAYIPVPLLNMSALVYLNKMNSQE